MTLGNIFIYQMQRDFGALAVAKTTTVRKLVSVTLSVLLFGHSLSLAQYGAIATVFAAPFVERQVARFSHGDGKKGQIREAVKADKLTRVSRRSRSKAKRA